MPQILREVQRNHPGITIHQVEAGTPEQYRQLADGRLDIGIGRASQTPAEVTSDLIRLDPLGVLVPDDHRFADLRRRTRRRPRRRAASARRGIADAGAQPVRPRAVPLGRIRAHRLRGNRRKHPAPPPTSSSSIAACTVSLPRSAPPTGWAPPGGRCPTPSTHYPWSLLWRDANPSPHIAIVIDIARRLAERLGLAGARSPGRRAGVRRRCWAPPAAAAMIRCDAPGSTLVAPNPGDRFWRLSFNIAGFCPITQGVGWKCSLQSAPPIMRRPASCFDRSGRPIPRRHRRTTTGSSVMGIIAWIILGLVAGLAGQNAGPRQRPARLDHHPRTRRRRRAAGRFRGHQGVPRLGHPGLLQPVHLGLCHRRRGSPAARLQPDHRPAHWPSFGPLGQPPITPPSTPLTPPPCSHACRSGGDRPSAQAEDVHRGGRATSPQGLKAISAKQRPGAMQHNPGMDLAALAASSARRPLPPFPSTGPALNSGSVSGFPTTTKRLRPERYLGLCWSGSGGLGGGCPRRSDRGGSSRSSSTSGKGCDAPSVPPRTRPWRRLRLSSRTGRAPGMGSSAEAGLLYFQPRSPPIEQLADQGLHPALAG